MAGKQIAATIGISGLSIFAGIGIALLFLQPKVISQTASKDEHSSSKKITREEAEAEIDSALRQGGEVFMREKFLKVWRSEIKTLDDFRLSPSAAEALAEYGTFMRKYHASGENRRSRPPMDEQKRDEAKRAMHVVEKTFPLAAMGCQKALTYLFENGISDVNYIGDGGYLHYAAAAGRTDMIDFLLKCGADINFLDKDGDTPLRWASANQDTKTVYLTVWHLIDRGADLFVGNQRHGLRPDWLLYDSAKYGDLNRMKKLVEEFHVKPKDAEFFSKILKDTASSKIKAYLEREADRRNWAEAWREEERKEKEREGEEKRKEKAQPADAAAEGKAQPAALKSESAEAKLLAEPPQKAPVKITHGRVMTQEKPEKPATPREDPAEVQRRIKQYQLAMQQQFEFDRLQLQRTHELNAQMNQAIMNMGQSMIDPMPIMPTPMPMPRPSRPTGYCSIHKQSYSLPGSCPQCSAPNFGFPTPLDGLR